VEHLFAEPVPLKKPASRAEAFSRRTKKKNLDTGFRRYDLNERKPAFAGMPPGHFPHFFGNISLDTPVCLLHYRAQCFELF